MGREYVIATAAVESAKGAIVVRLTGAPGTHVSTQMRATFDVSDERSTCLFFDADGVSTSYFIGDGNVVVVRSSLPGVPSVARPNPVFGPPLIQGKDELFIGDDGEVRILLGMSDPAGLDDLEYRIEAAAPIAVAKSEGSFHCVAGVKGFPEGTYLQTPTSTIADGLTWAIEPRGAVVGSAMAFSDGEIDATLRAPDREWRYRSDAFRTEGGIPDFVEGGPGRWEFDVVKIRAAEAYGIGLSLFALPASGDHGSAKP